MEITSHFIGINLDSKIFVDLFVSLQLYLNANSISSCVEFHNPLSLHISLYYFDDRFSVNEYSKLLKKIKELNEEFVSYSLKINKCGIFQRNGVDRLCYIYPSSHLALKEINNYFKHNFPNSIVDNTQDFSPHISLFKIVDHQVFYNHKDQILSIINQNLLKIQTEKAYKSINLYCVNSKFRPQIQLITV